MFSLSSTTNAAVAGDAMPVTPNSNTNNNSNNANPSQSATTTPDSDWDVDLANDLSFEYVEGENGQIIRRSKGSSKSLPNLNGYNHYDDDEEREPSPSPAPAPEPSRSSWIEDADNNNDKLQARNSHLTRESLSRSTSAPYPMHTNASSVISESQSSYQPPALNAIRSRSFQRVTSGPAFGGNGTGAGPAKLPRRVTMEESNHIQTALNDNERDLAKGAAVSDLEQEKENLRGAGRRITTATSSALDRPSYVSSTAGAGRIMRSAPSTQSDFPATSQRPSGVSSTYLNIPSRGAAPSKLSSVVPSYRVTGRIGEVEDSPLEDDGNGGDTEVVEPPLDPARRPPLVAGIVRPRTNGGSSASRRTGSEEGPIETLKNSGTTRPRRSASVGDAVVAAAAAKDGKNQDDASGQGVSSRPGTSMGHHRRISPDEADLRTQRRRDSDEAIERREQPHLRSQSYSSNRLSPSPPQATNSSSRPAAATPPQMPAHRRRDSDTLRSFAPSTSQSQHLSTVGVSSMQFPGSPTLEQIPSRLSPSARGVVPVQRRSPTSTAGSMYNGSASARTPASAPVSGDEESPAMPERRERKHKKDSTSASISASGGEIPVGHQTIVVNKKQYARLGILGKGGSSRVFRVMNSVNDLFAIKRVALDKTDEATLMGFMNEIALLKRLNGNSRIIRLFDSEVRPGPQGSRGHLLLVMECGDIDFAKLLAEQQKEPLNMVWVGYYWQQMLQAVQVIHDEKIVHSDLKPANFVVVRGQLKLIDFGIANAIANDTTNVHRDHQIGTLNYMSPEAIDIPDGMRHLKVGRGSDVWSLGCILYQMVYGYPPFHQFGPVQKMRVIPDSNYQIDYPEYATPVIPSAKGSAGAEGSPPKKVEEVKRRVRGDVIRNMKNCLKRSPKERATIPMLLEEVWIGGKDSSDEAPVPQNHEQPKLKDLLASDQTVITPHYMKQLLWYAQTLNIVDENDPRLEIEAQRLVHELQSIVLQ